MIWPPSYSFFAGMLLNVWIVSAFAAVFLAAVAWVAPLIKLQLGHTYPFIINILDPTVRRLPFHDLIMPPKIIGAGSRCLGIIVRSRR